MSKSVWLVAVMGLLTLLLMAVGMEMTLGNFQSFPAAEAIRLSEAVAREYKAEHVTVKINLKETPATMALAYSSLIDTKFNLSVQNTEMENVAKYAIKNYKGKEQTMVDEIQVTRSETHGRGCFQQTYVAHLTVPNPLRRTERAPLNGPSINPRKP